MTPEDFLLRVRGDISNAREQLDELRKKIAENEEQAKHSSGVMTTALSTAMGTFGGLWGHEYFQRIMGGVKSAFDFAVNGAIGMNSTLETTTLRFGTLMGSSALATQHVRDLFEIAKKTPFETGPIIQASLKLQTFGGAALNTKENIILLGDAAAATGAPIDELGFWVGRLYGNLKGGQPFGEAAMRLQELAVLTPEARREMEAMQASGKKADEIFAAFKETLGNFSGAMEKQAGTWEGVVSTFTDTVNILIADTFKPYFEVIRDLGKEVNTALDNMASSQAIDDFKGKIKDSKTTVIDLAENGVGGLIKALSFLMVELNAVYKVFGNVVQVAQGAELALLYAAKASNLLADKLTIGTDAYKKQADMLDDWIGKVLVTMRDRGKAMQDASVSQEAWTTWAEKAEGVIKNVTQAVREQKEEILIYGPTLEQLGAKEKAATETAKEKAKRLREEKKELKENEEALKAHITQSEHFNRVGYDTANMIGKSLSPFIVRLRMDVHEAMFASEQLRFNFAAMPGPVSDMQRHIERLRNTLWGLKDAMKGGLEALPELMIKSITGGGGIKGALQGAASGIGSEIGKNLQTGLTNKLTDFGQKALNPLMSGMLSALPGVGAFMSTIGTKLLGKLMSAFGPSKQELEGREVEKKFEAQFGSFDKMMQAVVGAYEATGRSARMAEQDVLALMRAEKQGGDAVKAVIDKINGAFDEQKQDVIDLKAAVERYGFSIEELGPAMKKQELDKQAGELINDWRLLVGSGIELDTVNEKMSESMQKYLNTAAKTGMEVPEKMKPIIESMIKQGLLTDENGNKIESTADLNIKWGQDLTEVMTKFVTKLDQVLTKIGLIPQVAQDAANRMPTDWSLPDTNFGASTELIPSFSNRPLERVTGAGLAMLHPGDVVGVPSAGQFGRVVVNVHGNIWTERDLADALSRRLSQDQRDRFMQRAG